MGKDAEEEDLLMDHMMDAPAAEEAVEEPMMGDQMMGDQMMGDQMMM